MSQENEWVLLAHFSNVVQGQLLATALESEGIKVQVFDAQSSRMLNHLAPAIPTRLMVLKEDLSRAQELLKDMESGKFNI